MEQRTFRYFDFVMVLFVTVLILSNILSSAKIIDVGLRVGKFSFAFDAGTLVFPISYIFGDILTEVYGYARSRRVIWMGFWMMALVGAMIWLAGVLPGESEWQGYAGQSAYDAILGGVSGLVVASLIAYWLGEFSNSYVLAKMKVASQGKYIWTRTITSTLIGQAIDTVIFFTLATLLGVFPPEIVVTLVITNYILKVGIEVILTPVTLRIIKWLKQAENEDYFDTDTQFNPFHIAQ